MVQSEAHIIRDLNHDLLLNTPNLLYRLVDLVRTKDYTVRFANTSHEIDHWLRVIDEVLSDDDFNEDILNSNNNRGQLGKLKKL